MPDVQLTGYGGVGEIGGNAFLLESNGSRILLDLGRRFGSNPAVDAPLRPPGWNDYFDDYLKPRTFRLVHDLDTLGLIPPIPGLYRTDLGGPAGPSGIDAVVVSHAHMDHVGLLGLVKPDITVQATAQSRAILQSMQTTGIGGAESDFVRTRARGKAGRKKDGGVTVDPRFDDGPRRTFATQETHVAGAFTIRSLPVDHSIPGAQAALVEGPEGTLAYTGDFRLHGRGRHLSERLVQRAAGVDILVTEGTNVGTGHGHAKSTDDESKVAIDIETAVTHADARLQGGFIGVAYPPRDIDRFVSLHAVARKMGRRLAISTKQAHLLDALRAAGRDDLPDPKTDRSLAVYFEASNKGMLLEHPDSVPVAAADLSVVPTVVAPESYSDLLEKDYPEWARPYLRAPTMVGPLDVRREPGAFLLSISYWSITELFDIFPDRSKARGLYIHSQTQPFNDDMIQDRRKLDRWLRAYKLDFASAHVSGHLDEKSLEWVLDEIRPKTLVPVHSERPDVTAQKYEARTGQRALMPVWGQPLALG